MTRRRLLSVAAAAGVGAAFAYVTAPLDAVSGPGRGKKRRPRYYSILPSEERSEVAAAVKS